MSIELPKNHFKDVKKVQIFHMLGEGGGATNIWKILYVFCRYFLKASIFHKLLVLKCME